jgi:hypothetical protein
VTGDRPDLLASISLLAAEGEIFCPAPVRILAEIPAAERETVAGEHRGASCELLHQLAGRLLRHSEVPTCFSIIRSLLQLRRSTAGGSVFIIQAFNSGVRHALPSST